MPKELGTFEILVMLACLRVKGNHSGMAMLREITRITGRKVAVGSVYATVDRLYKKGLMARTHRPSHGERGGRSGVDYLLTEKGQKDLEANLLAIEQMRSDLSETKK